MRSRDPLSDVQPLIRRVYAYVAYRIGDGPDAEDVTSETFERAIRYRDSFDPRKGEPIAWLIGIARRCIEGARASGGSWADGHTELPDLGSGQDVEGDAVRRIGLTSALQRLDERDRELIALRYGADLTARRIAELLDMRTNAVEVALHRALGTLRERLQGDAPSRPGELVARMRRPEQAPSSRAS